MDNKLELLVGIVADTEGSKDDIQTQLTRLASELKGLDEIKLGISKDDIKALQDIAKIDFSNLKGMGDGVGAGLGKATREVDNFATVSKEKLKDAMNIAGLQLNNTQALKSVDEIEARVKELDKNADVKLVKMPDSMGNEVDKIVAKYKIGGKEIVTSFEQVSIAVDKLNGATTFAYMPKQISEVDTNLKSATQSMNKYYQEVQKAEKAGKINTEQAAKLVAEMKKIENASKDMDKLTLSIDSKKELDAREKIHTSIKSTSGELEKQIKLNNEALAAEKQQLDAKKEAEKVQEKIRKTLLEITRMQGKDPQTFGNNPEVDKMVAGLKAIDPASDGAAKSVKKVSDGFDEMKASATVAGRESMTVMDSFKVAMQKFPVWMAASTAFYGTVRTIKSALQEIVELDSQITVLRRVAGDGIDVNEVMKESIQLASTLGNEIKDVNEGFIAFARQGFRGDDLSYMAEYATLLGNISEMDVEQSASILTAALKGFNLEASEAARVVDALNEVNNISLHLQ